MCEKKVYVKVPYEVKVPVKCKMPEVSCDFDKNTSVEVISGMLECIVDLKESRRVCNGE